MPSSSALRVTARIAAFMPGASPPLVRTAMCFISARLAVHGTAAPISFPPTCSPLSRPRRVERLHVDFPGPLPHRIGVEPRLHPQQHVHVDPESLLDPQGHFR